MFFNDKPHYVCYKNDYFLLMYCLFAINGVFSQNMCHFVKENKQI